MYWTDHSLLYRFEIKNSWSYIADTPSSLSILVRQGLTFTSKLSHNVALNYIREKFPFKFLEISKSVTLKLGTKCSLHTWVEANS
jgi:hypothetical protein